jgi:N-acyl-D-aspartate/D-glutamate deacylase
LHGLTKLVTMLPPSALEGRTTELRRRLRDPDTWAEYRAFQRPLYKMGLTNEWERIALFEAHRSPEWAGKDFRTIGQERSQHPLDALMDILLEAGDDAPSVLMTGLVHTEDELEHTFVHPTCMPESDVTALATDGPLAGQSFLGAYTWAPYYLRRFVRERSVLALEEGSIVSPKCRRHDSESPTGVYCAKARAPTWSCLIRPRSPSAVRCGRPTTTPPACTMSW